MKIASFNVNSINKRMVAVQDWLNQHTPDVLVLQELKCESHKFPELLLSSSGYQVSMVGEKAYNGVAIFTKALHTVRAEALPGDEQDTQARYLEIEYHDQAGKRMVIAGIYLPNGNPVCDEAGEETAKFRYKISWMQRLYARAEALLREEVPVIITGDFNVIPADLDVYDATGWQDDALCQPKTRQQFFALRNLGYVDAWRTMHPRMRAYSFWDYQAGRWQKGDGIRIDHLMLSPLAAERLLEAEIDPEPRGRPQPSDHTPIWCRLADE